MLKVNSDVLSGVECSIFKIKIQDKEKRVSKKKKQGRYDEERRSNMLMIKELICVDSFTSFGMTIFWTPSSVTILKVRFNR